MTTTTHPQAPKPVPQPKSGGGANKPQRIQQPLIEGRYRPITAHQIIMAWWLFSSDHMTRRCLRIYFAAHEMAERRRYSGPDSDGHAHFKLTELKELVGGRGSTTADRDLRADVKRLAELGLATISRHKILFATSIDQIHVEDTSDFFSMWSGLRKGMARRHIPVPRRTLRALAAGFRTADTAYVLGAMLSAVFWHKKQACYSLDGRLKDAWVSETFRIGLSTTRKARKHLVELGWLRELEAPQWLRNKYGTHIVVNVDWKQGDQATAANDADVDNSGATPVGEGGSAAGLSTPRAQNAAGLSTPCLNRSASPTENLNTRRPRATAPDPAGVSRTKGSDQKSREASTAPNIRDVRPSDLKCSEALRELYRQAVASGIACSSDAGELNFFALANRARTRGNRPGALFISNLKKGRSHFITIEDEEVGRRMLTELRDGPQERRTAAKKPERRLSEEERIVEVCLQQAKRLRGFEGFDLARRAKGWTRDQWDRAEASYNRTQTRQWYSADEFETDFTPFAGVAR